MIDPGRMKHLVTVQSPVRTRSSVTGGWTTSWGTSFTAYAEIGPFSGREYLLAQQPHPEVDTKITIWYATTITDQFRIKHGNRYYKINAVMNTAEENEELVLWCTEWKQS
jgi:SPP1 family predicted phage head-tail adaptor